MMNKDLIFDIGLHEGEDTEFYLKKGFRVVAVEANPDLSKLVEDKLCKYIESGQLTIVNAAITDKAGPIAFYINEQKTVWGTTSSEWADRNERLGTTSRKITVDGIEFRKLLEDFGTPYYLKIDIEGADLLCVEALGTVLSRPKYVSIESNKTSWKGLVNEFELLAGLGYSKFKIVDQGLVKTQVAPLPAKEGGSIEHTFSPGSSGLFGEEAPGSWLTQKAAIRAYRKIFFKYFLFGDDGILLRFRNFPLLWRLANMGDINWYDTHAGR